MASIPLPMASPSTHPAEFCCHFTKLSVDVFAILADYLKTEDIQSARLAGRDLHSLSSPYLFRAVTFAPHQEHLDRLSKITRDPILSYHTRILRYDTTIFRLPEYKDELDPFEFRPRWENTTGTWVRTDPCTLVHECGPETRMKALAEFTAYVHEQYAILERLEKHLCQIISSLPKLSTIILCNTAIKGSDRFKFALSENSISRRWARGNQMMTLFRVISTLGSNITKIGVQGHNIQKPFRLLDNVDFGYDGDKVGSIKYCLRSGFKTATYTKEKIPFIHGSTLTLNADELSMTKAIFGNLTHLNLGIDTAVPFQGFYVDPEDTPKAYWVDFPAILQSMTKIVDLSLDMKYHRAVDQQHSCTYFHDDIRELFGNHPVTFPRLERLKLSQFRSCGASIQNLLQNHSKIKDLTLKFIIEIKTSHVAWDWSTSTWTAHPDWVQCIETMRQLKLQRLVLRGIEGFGHWSDLYGSENQDLTLARIHDYILHGYGDNPLPTRLPLEKNNLAWDEEFW
ncbi:uncharacterized protein LY89DRAFT_738239 [Mollisia scopiformis]|uniref:Uncharacterized protein n=1 Tax=Mollisia scopiformis TaxID=149040 RepID=A0A194WWY9_MOLSC|nr:uncharacterized protein LY89DRAFT_738239 [Mollisia scopiformis]KUJ12450.1 hypothetical protein LY89DRAFT_738239 [Mollisia scopiformis]